ncbi:MAG: class I SAM-dependent methyltransferase [Solirubrobacteraceae bacterium]
MAFGRTDALREQLELALPERPFTVRFWDGSEVRATEPAAPTFTINSPQALAHVLRAPGELGLGRAYVSGLIEVDDLDAALLVVDHFEPPPIDLGTRARLGLALLRATGIVAPPRVPGTELRLRGERHTPARDRAAVAYHYDAGNDFFAIFLDPTMTYSCARFASGAETLEAAQTAKLELVYGKLGVSPGARVLEVGCGWGSFALHAATHHGVNVVGITLSERQAELARERVVAAGLADRVEICLLDYRELEGEQFDAIATIEMIEAVGEERVDEFAGCLARALRPGGRLVCQGIAKLQDFDTPDEGPFSERFVFPDGVPLPISRVQLALERAGLATSHLEAFPEDYVKTLKHWIAGLDERRQAAILTVGAERVRIWSLYLRSARQAFETNWATVYQLQARKPAL